MPHIHDKYDFTVSAYIIHPTEQKICLHMHKKLGKWLQPGGHIELNEDPLQALHHELAEELGFSEADSVFIDQPDQPKAGKGKVLPLPFHYEVHDFNESHQHIDLEYLLQAKITAFNPEQTESQDVRWLSIDEVRKFHDQGEVHDSTMQICEWIAGKYFLSV